MLLVVWSIGPFTLAVQSAENPDQAGEFAAWRAQREKQLRDPNGYLTLAGLYWLHDGGQTFGTAQDNDLVFPEGAPDKAGMLMLKAGVVTLTALPDAHMTVDGAAVSTLRLKSDALGQQPTKVTLGDMTFWLIDRSLKLGIRLRDPRSPVLANYKETRAFPFSERWRIEATYEVFDTPRSTAVPTILGTSIDMKAPGQLTFTIDGQPHTLLVTERSESRLSVIFGDQTNGQQTYGGGRFLNVPAPADGSTTTTIDFNRAYNPPCAYSPFTTCPVPPQRNRLPIAIQAGETIEGNERH